MDQLDPHPLPEPSKTIVAAGTGGHNVTPTPAGSLLPRFIRAEANLLRLPLFALHTKRLKTLDGIQCKGSITRDGQTHEFTFQATRNTKTLYPGPLARAAHLAFLSIASEQTLPLQNPVAWSWRDLCRRMDIPYSGRTVLQLKQAINSTKGLLLFSEYALYSKPQHRLIRNHQDALSLYDRVSYVGSELPDGTRADRNYLWFSDWYLQNLNAMFTAPLDFQLWRYLEKRSAIASRLYEFLLLNFYCGSPLLRINYPNLVQFLPVRPEQFRSLAQRQLDPALTLLKAAHVIANAAWSTSKGGQLQITLYRGERLTAPPHQTQTMFPFLEEDFTAAIQVQELRDLKPPEWYLVTDFYRLWTPSESHRPTPKELDQARDLISEHGQAKAKALVLFAIKHMKHKWPDAKVFGALLKYLPEASQDYDRQQHQLAIRHAEEEKQRSEREEESRRIARHQALAPLWEELPQGERSAIRESILSHSQHLQRTPDILKRLCLDELERRLQSAPSSPNHEQTP